MDKKPRYLSTEEALEKLKKYCAYSERSHQDVRSKLIKLGVYGDRLESIISELISENYLDEERFARAYARGKFKYNHWGRYKILQGLKAKRISDYCIRKAMSEIDEDDYFKTLNELIERRRAHKPDEEKQKTVNYLIQKGYEAALVWSILNQGS